MDNADSAIHWHSEQRISKTMKSLKKNNMSPVFVESAAEAVETVMTRIPVGASVTHGGSRTLEQLGIKEQLASGNYNYLKTTRQDPDDIRRKAFFADVYLTSVNAITLEGNLLVVDGFGNRAAALAFGPTRVLVIAGKNKIVDSMDDAFNRIRNYAAPIHAKRRGWDLPCGREGRCTYCKSPARICNKFMVVEYERDPKRIVVILVGEDLGI